MRDSSSPSGDQAVTQRPLLRALAAARLPATGRYILKAGWVSQAWVGEKYVVRLSNGQIRDAYKHEAKVADLLTGTSVPHARHIAHGNGWDGPWCVSERLPGETLFDAWAKANLHTRQALIESLGVALRALHLVPVPPDLRPPWLVDALAGGWWPAYHPPVVSAALQQVEAARRVPGRDPRLFADVAAWIAERMPLFVGDSLVLVHGDVHGSNVMVDQSHVTGLIDFAEALAQPSDAELDTILRWCARAREFPPTPDTRGLEVAALEQVPGWLRNSYPELFERKDLRERLNFYDMCVELALCAHHPQPAIRDMAQDRITGLLSGHNHLDGLAW